MSKAERVLSCIGALQQGDMELASSLLADNFELVGFAPKKLNKPQFLTVQSELLAAMPDFSYNMTELREEEDGVVNGTVTITGTHSAALSIPLFGIEHVAATGIAVELPSTLVVFEVPGEQVSRMEFEIMPGGGLAGLLQQTAAELPLIPRRDVFAE